MISAAEDALKKEKKKSRTKFSIHVVDEITFIAVLKMLNMYTSHPPLSSKFVLELHNRYGKYFIIAKYNDKIMPIPKCGTE
jgi:hypothetical protein